MSNEQLESELDELQRRVERLRVLYEQYFLGIEKTPPYQVQKDVVRIMHRLTHVRIHSTTLKFRLQGLMQRFNAHKSYWARTIRDIEEGRFKRAGVRTRPTAAADGLTPADHAAIHSIREAQGEEAAEEAIRRRSAKREAEADVAENFLRQMQGMVNDDTSSSAAAVAARAMAASASATPTHSHAAAAASSAAPSAAADPTMIRGISAEELAARTARLREMRERLARGGAPSPAGAAPTSAPARPDAAPRAVAPAAPDAARQVYDKLVATKRQLNESTDGLNYESLRRNMEKQADALREKRGCKSVDFDVVVKDGKAFLKPIVRD